MKNTAIDYAKINDAVMKNAPLDTLITLCRGIDLESCFEPVFEPPKSFLDMCKRYWENYYAEIMKSKPAHAYDTLFSAKYCKRGLFRLIGGSHYETTIQYRTLYAPEP